MSAIVYRILNADGVQCNTKGYPNYRSPGAPQPKGRPFERQTGQIVWEDA